MNKILMILSCMILTNVAGAQTPAEFKWDAEMRFRYTNYMSGNPGTTIPYFRKEGSQSAMFTQRNKVGSTIVKGENFSGRVSLINNAVWGSATAQNGTATQVATQGGKYSAATSENLLLVNEAWGWWKAGDMWSVKFGRAGFTFGDGTIIGKDDYNATPYSYDGAWFAFGFDFADLWAFGIKSWDPNSAAANNNSDAETNIYGAVMKFKNMPDALKYAGIHFFQTNAENVNLGAGAATANAMRVGLTVTGDVNAIDYRGTFDMLTGTSKTYGTTGTETKLTSNMIDAEVGFNMPEVMKARIALMLHRDSGDTNATDDKNETYLPLRPDTHVQAGLADVIAWGNSTYFGLSAAINPMEDTKVGLNYYIFSATADKGAINLANFSSTTGAGSSITNTASKTDVGTELDIYASKSYASNFDIGLTYGMFTPGAAIKDNLGGTADTFNKLEVEAKLTF